MRPTQGRTLGEDKAKDLTAGLGAPAPPGGVGQSPTVYAQPPSSRVAMSSRPRSGIGSQVGRLLTS